MKKLHDALANLVVEKQDAITAYPAKLGDGSGRVIAGAGLVYVRVADVVAIAACTSVPPVHDLEVWVGYENLQRNVLRVLGQRDALGNRQFIPGVAAHAAMHEFMGAGSLGGTDVVKVQLQQFMPLAVWPYDGLKVIVWPGVVWINGQYKLVADLNQYDKPVPKIIDFGEYAGPAANKEMYYLVGIDNTGNIQVVAGNQVDWGTLALTDIPSAPTNMLYPLAAVRRSFEQAGIVINRESSDIVDLRFPIAHKHRSEDITSGTISANRLPLFTATEPGAVPAPGTVSNKVLRDDGTWVSAGTGDMTKAVYDTNNNGIVDAAESVPWSGVTGKPSTFPPETHNHDERYYTETELNTSGAGGQVHWDNVSSKPSTYPPSAHQHAAGDVTSGTLSTDRFSAYADLVAENRLGMAQDRLLRGQDARLTFVTPVEDFLGEGGIPSGWYWAGSPFVTPNTIYRWGNSHLYVQNAGVAPSRCFLVTNLSSAIPSLFGINAVGNNGFYVGLRLDDGSDNNYVELVNMVEGSPYLRSFAIRHRTGGGAVSTNYHYQNQPIYADTISAWYSGTQWSNWNIHAEAWLMYIRREYLGSTYVLGRTWIPARRGIVFNFVYEWNHVLIDAVS